MFYFMTEKLFKFKTLLVKFWTGIVCSCDSYISIEQLFGHPTLWVHCGFDDSYASNNVREGGVGVSGV